VDRRRTSLAKSDWLEELTAGWVCNWRRYLVDGDDAELTKSMLRHERTGRPLGDASFVKKLELLLGRTLARGRPGPKPKRRTRRHKRKAGKVN